MKAALRQGGGRTTRMSPKLPFEIDDLAAVGVCTLS